MADDETRIVYSYEGDISSLRQATETAIGLLDQYQAQVDRISADGGFGKNTKVAKSFQAQVTAATKEVAKLQDMMQKVADVRLPTGSDLKKQLSGVLGSFSGTLQSMSGKSGLSTNDVKAMSSQLKEATAIIKANESAVSNLIQEETRWQVTLGNVSSTVNTMKQSVVTSLQSVLAPMKQLTAPLDASSAKIQSFRHDNHNRRKKCSLY